MYQVLRALTRDDQGRLFTTFVWTYNDLTGEFGHHYAYGDDHPEWNAIHNIIGTDVVATLNPIAGTLSRADFSGGSELTTRR